LAQRVNELRRGNEYFKGRSAEEIAGFRKVLNADEGFAELFYSVPDDEAEILLRHHLERINEH
jgi:hypothetical protein